MTNRTFTLSSGREVTLSENEMVILDRMQEPDGREFQMVFRGTFAPAQRVCPLDQAEGLMVNGLTASLAEGIGPIWGMELTDQGREVLAQMHHQEDLIAQATGDQYAELSLDDLIALAAERAEEFLHSPGEGALADSLAEVVRAVKARHDEAAPARARVGEYLRQIAIKETRHVYLGRRGSDGNAYGPKPAPDEIAEIREDQYSGKATLRLSDLRQVVPVRVRDTEGEFFAEQERRLEILMQHAGAKLPEKQKALLPCVAKGHLSSGVSGSFSGERDCTCSGVDGRTLNALEKKIFIGSRVKPGMHGGSILLIKKPIEG
jgi:hypothetical protein